MRKKYEENLKVKLEEGYDKEKKSIIGFFFRNYRFTYLIVFTICLMGLFSLFAMPKEAEPEVEIPFAVVTTVYPGATPTDIEELVTEKLEEKIENLDNLKLYTSNSGRGISSIFVEFEAEANLRESFRKLREAVDNAKTGLPKETEDPQVLEINFNDFPIVTYSLVGEYNEADLKKYADELKKELETLKDISKVELLGGVTREFQVIVNQTKLASYGISLGQIINSIQGNNVNLPAGNIKIDNYKYGVRIEGRLAEINNLNDIVVATYEGSPVFLKDLGEIKDHYKEKTSESKIGFKNTPPKNTISLQIYKKTGGNILNIVKNSQEVINKVIKNEKLPRDIIIQKTNDNSVYIKDDLRTLGQSGIQTFILIGLILLVVLSVRGAIITAISVPITFLLTFLILYIEGMTLNSMVLFSLVLSLGLMVDNTIIIMEGINEYTKDHKMPVEKSALLSVWNFKKAISAGTLTTVSAFVPMLLVSGIMGEYMSILPKTISATLLSSLFVALVIMPVLATKFIKTKKGENGFSAHNGKKRHLFIAEKIEKLKKKYASFLREVLPNKKKRAKLVVVSWILFIIAVAFPVSGLMKVQMFPKIDLDYFIVNIKLPAGSILSKTQEITAQAEEIVTKIPELDNYVSNVGSSMSLGYGGGGSSGEHLANITVNLSEKRKRPSYEITESVREELERIQDAEVTVEELSAGPPSGAPIEVRVFGEDTAELSILTEKITEYFKKVSGVINVKNSIVNSTGEFTFTIDKQKANYYGLNIYTVASTLRNAIYGTTASTVNIDGDDVDITVKYDKETFNNVGDLENVLLFTSRGENIPLKQVASLELKPSLLTISHRNGKKQASVSADLEKGANLQKILKEFEEEKGEMNIPLGYSVEIGGETEDIAKSFQEIFLSMILAVILIAFILVLQFNSFKQPFIIIFSVPLAIIGVMVGLNITRQPFSFPAFIGIVSLAGIVVNDAIVLIDRINKNREHGLEMIEAIVEGGMARMQPIFLTSITTIAGIFPLIYASELWRGLSITVISGLIFSTVLILIIVPLLYFGISQEWGRKKMWAFWLAWFLGIFGAHRFYLKEKKAGRLMFSLSVSCILISILASSIPGIPYTQYINMITSGIITILFLTAMIDAFRYMVLTREEF